ncbi:MAG: hypothetical protein ABIN67_02240, partial [Ferruginibacter sp.]
SVNHFNNQEKSRVLTWRGPEQTGGAHRLFLTFFVSFFCQEKKKKRTLTMSDDLIFECRPMQKYFTTSIEQRRVLLRAAFVFEKRSGRDSPENKR